MKFRPIQQLTAATLLFATTAVPLLAGEKPAPPPLQTTIANFAGHEIDFTAKWAPAEWLKIEAGYSHFFARDYLRTPGRTTMRISDT